MDVALPMASVIPSLDGPVLAALAGTTLPLTLTRVHRLAGRGSLAGVRRVLLRMTDVGLVHEVPGGFVLNRAHLGAPAVEALAGLYGALMERIRQAVDEWDGAVSLVGLFGSAARRDGDETSDIDILVVSDAGDLDDFTDALAENVRLWTGNDAQVIGLSSGHLARLCGAREPIVAGWERDLVVVCGERAALRNDAA